MKYLVIVCAFFVLLISVDQVLAATTTTEDQHNELYAKAMNGDAMALYDLGVLYAKNTNTPDNLIKAHAFLTLASAISNRYVGDVLSPIAQKLTTAQLAKAEKLYDELWDKIPKK